MQLCDWLDFVCRIYRHPVITSRLFFSCRRELIEGESDKKEYELTVIIDRKRRAFWSKRSNHWAV